MIKKNEKNNVTIALNVLYSKKEKIYLPHVSKHNSNREKQVVLSIIPNGEKWQLSCRKKLSALLRGITSKYYGDFYCLICLRSFRTNTNLNCIKRYVKIKIFVM